MAVRRIPRRESRGAQLVFQCEQLRVLGESDVHRALASVPAAPHDIARDHHRVWTGVDLRVSLHHARSIARPMDDARSAMTKPTKRARLAMLPFIAIVAMAHVGSPTVFFD